MYIFTLTKVTDWNLLAIIFWLGGKLVIKWWKLLYQRESCKTRIGVYNSLKIIETKITTSNVTFFFLWYNLIKL